MKLFECAWRDGFLHYERFYDTVTKQSVSKRVDIPCEWYEESSKGHYTYILDDTVTLEKKQGRAKKGRGKYGFLDPTYRNIRDNYWENDNYNKEPRIWYLDIETRSGKSFKHKVHEHQKIRVRKKS